MSISGDSHNGHLIDHEGKRTSLSVQDWVDQQKKFAELEHFFYKKCVEELGKSFNSQP
ncbi:hypothetical protein [Actinomadura atramentaria]|uniref:hypothetical protein n=1 Tax=Actinomadura atramentaria TaxID=1990 RepID=UPI0003797B3E|nr:hypothetical protein [Actinomadura atramentaria]